MGGSGQLPQFLLLGCCWLEGARQSGRAKALGARHTGWHSRECRSPDSSEPEAHGDTQAVQPGTQGCHRGC